MTVQICGASLKKLTHESPEIRLRTLEQVEAKILRALAHNETIDFKPGELCKQLIRWFGLQPLQAPEKALRLMARILRSQYVRATLQQLRPERFLRELGKIQQLLRGRDNELQIVEEIRVLLQDAQQRCKIDEPLRNRKLDCHRYVEPCIRDLNRDADRRSQSDTDRRSQMDTDRRSQMDTDRRSQIDTDRRSQLDGERKSQPDVERRSYLDAERQSDIERRNQHNADRPSQNGTERRSQNGTERRSQNGTERRSHADLERVSQNVAQRPSQNQLDELAESAQSLSINDVGGVVESVLPRHSKDARQSGQTTHSRTISNYVGGSADSVVPRESRESRQSAKAAPVGTAESKSLRQSKDSRQSGQSARSSTLSNGMEGIIDSLLPRQSKDSRQSRQSGIRRQTARESDLIDGEASRQTIQSETRSTAERIECPAIDCEPAWSKVAIADYNTMKMVAEMLINSHATCEDLVNAMQHLQITMNDYPAEFLLQAPHIYLNLLQVYDKAELLNCPLDDVIDTIMAYLKLLKERIQMRRKCLAYAQPLSSGETLVNTQLKVEKALKLLLDKTLNKLETQIFDFGNETTLVLELIMCIFDLYETQHLCVERNVLIKLANIADKLRQSCEQDEHFTLQRIKYLLVTSLMQQAAENNAKRKPCLELELLEPLLCDYTLLLNFPKRQTRLRKLLYSAHAGLEKKYDTLAKYEESFAAAIALIKAPTCYTAAEIIERSKSVCLALTHLQSFKLVELLFDAIVECNRLYPAQPALKSQAIALLRKLMQLSHEPLKACVYRRLTQTIKKHCACLMNGENFVAGMPNAKLLFAQIVGVPLSTALLLQVIEESAECTHAGIKSNCEDILTLLLKAQHLLGVHWLTLLELLLPLMPLLQCCTFSACNTALLLKLYDPDREHLPFLNVLQGNVAFLFSDDAGLRGEALTRVVYMLCALKSSCEYVPNIMEVRDLIPSDLCVLPAPRSYARIFYTCESFGELATLHNLLSMLESCDIEPLIRKTTLMQLNVMCQSWQLTAAFCDESAYYLVLQALENSLRKASFADYTDAAIPAISILTKVLLYDASLRRELASTTNIYVLLLRALILYQNDIQVREDASICLYLLNFAFYIDVPAGGGRIEAPKIMANNLCAPLVCVFKPSCACLMQQNLDADFRALFANTHEATHFLRQLIATQLCKHGAGTHTNKCLELQQRFDYNAALYLTQRDLRLLKATQPHTNLRRFMRAIANATEHRTLINAAITLKLQLLLQAADNGEAFVPNDMASELYKMLSKYLQLPPGNEMDFVLFEHLLELCMLCIRLPLPIIVACLWQSLQADFQHAFVTLLKNDEIPLRLYQKLCRLFALLLQTPPATDGSIFYSNFFDLLFELALRFFDKRDLQRVRCLLTLLQMLSAMPFGMPDRLLLYYCKRFLHLSVALKSYTQTGAQWQRDCLRLVCQLCAQMQQPEQTIKLSANLLKYLSGLCGHNDAQVRALAWCILAHVARFKAEDARGCEQLISELAFLPGGFLACCLSTLLDASELIVVRQLAGNLLVEMLGDESCAEFDTLTTLLEQHAFFLLAADALNNCMLEELLPRHYDYNAGEPLISCEIVSCFARICIRALELDAQFLAELCEKPFMFKLYELFKLPPAHDNPAYYAMCADICQLYALCGTDNFEFLQRTVCRDQVWLMCFCQLLDQPHAADEELFNVLQLLLALCKDGTAYAKLCEKFAKAPEFVVKLFLRSFSVAQLNKPLQRCALAVLSLLLVKSQTDLLSKCGDAQNFADILEQSIEIVHEATPAVVEDDAQKNKENQCNAMNRSFRAITKALELTKKVAESTELQVQKIFPLAVSENCAPGAAYIFIELFRLFTHLYSLKSCKFETPPSTAKVQVSETLAMLLKFSAQAHESASNLKLFDKVVKIFQAFLDEFNTSCTTFVRRYGEAKKNAILKNFQLLLNLLLHWFSAPYAVLTDERQAQEFTKVLIQIWPWLAHSGELKLLVLKVCAYLSDCSLIVCQQFATLNASFANSILQLVLKIVTAETGKVKAASTEECPVIVNGLRIVINCCACAEGRVSLVKAHALDVFDNLHPFNLKTPKIKLDILNAWLQFWELFSRYAEGAQARNLIALCGVIERMPARSSTRLLSLKILRNMCFAANNRSPLMTSADFICTVNAVITQPMDASEADATYEEQMLMCVAIWKLISAGIKFVAMIRPTKLAKKMRILREQLTTLEEENAVKFKQLPFARDLANVLDVIFGIFSE